MKKIIIIIAVILVAIFALIGYSGLFYSVKIEEKKVGPLTMVLKKHTGSYYKTGAVFKEVEAALEKTIGAKNLAGVGLYYDDPAKVKEELLRSECGVIIEMKKADLEKIDALKDGFIIKEFKETLCAVGEFPARTFLSYMIGPCRAYPKFAEFEKKKKITSDYSIEIYDMQSKKILYCMPIGGTK